MDPILRYIDLCNETALAREQDAKRTMPLSQDDDPRVDVCIYFLSPHRVKPIDLKFMSELSTYAPVVPVLAKADSMTTAELQHFRGAVQYALAQVRGCGFLSSVSFELLLHCIGMRLPAGNGLGAGQQERQAPDRVPVFGGGVEGGRRQPGRASFCHCGFHDYGPLCWQVTAPAT